MAVFQVSLAGMFCARPGSNTPSQSTVPSSTDEPLLFDISNAKPLCKHLSLYCAREIILITGMLVETKAVFWKAEVEVEEAAAFQIFITSPAQTVVSSVPISSLEIHFAHLSDPLIITHQSADVASSVSRVDLGIINLEDEVYPQVSTNLRLNPGAVLIFTGSLVSKTPLTLSVSGPDRETKRLLNWCLRSKSLSVISSRIAGKSKFL